MAQMLDLKLPTQVSPGAAGEGSRLRRLCMGVGVLRPDTMVEASFLHADPATLLGEGAME